MAIFKEMNNLILKEALFEFIDSVDHDDRRLITYHVKFLPAISVIQFSRREFTEIVDTMQSWVWVCEGGLPLPSKYKFN